jgi:predicted nucleic acid-binding protein
VRVVSNSSPLIVLAKLECFDLLQRLYGTVAISQEVYAEVVIIGSKLPGASETANSPWIQVQQVRHAGDVAAAQEVFGLGLGELSTLVLARETGADLVILDDLGARKLAKREGFRVQGTIGVLEASYRRGYLSNLRETYERLSKCGVFLNRDLLNRSLESVALPPI